MSRVVRLWAVVCLLAASCGVAQEVKTALESPYSRRHTFSVFAEYAPNSSHILVASTRQRKIADLGFAYDFRAVRFLGASLSYQAEARPLLFESDEIYIEDATETYNDPVAGSGSYPIHLSDVSYFKCTPTTGETTGKTANGGTFKSDYTITCGRRWTYGQAFSPAGFKLNFGIGHALQPYAVGSLGYMYTSRAVPSSGSSPMNYLIQVGAGVEVYRAKKSSLTAEVRVSHFSNWDTANENPGVDQMVYRIGYSFGR